MADSPGRLLSPCGVCTLMPEQQPHMQSDVPLQLTSSSLHSLHHERQLTVIWQAGIVIETCNLEWAERNLAFGQVDASWDSLRLEDGGDDTAYSCYLASGS